MTKSLYSRERTKAIAVTRSIRLIIKQLYDEAQVLLANENDDIAIHCKDC